MDRQSGLVSRRVFADEDLHRREAECVFRRCWLFVAHESMLPREGDFMSSGMGEVPVIVWRGRDARVRVFLDTCPHRGNKLCLYDQGNAASLTCSYHGWTFNREGDLTGVPFAERSYYDELDRARQHLVEAKVGSYAGLIFACWDHGAEPLDDYLGELRWWLDVFFDVPDLGGLEVIPGTQKYGIAGNWKLISDNFSGDRYHVPTSHSSMMKLGLATPPAQTNHGYFMNALAPFHGVGGFYTDGRRADADLAQAEKLGPEVVDWVREKQRSLASRMHTERIRPPAFQFGNCFPNLQLQSVGQTFNGNGLGLTHPRGVHESEMWQWTFIERQAPTIVKKLASRAASRAQSAAGMIGIDDSENFERILASTRHPMNDLLTFDYSMGMSKVGRWPGQDEWVADGLPGLIGPEFWEVPQRRFYAEWARRMGLDE